MDYIPLETILLERWHLKKKIRLSRAQLYIPLGLPGPALSTAHSITEDTVLQWFWEVFRDVYAFTAIGLSCEK